MLPLATIPASHPALWGELEVRPAESLLAVADATVLPPQPRRGTNNWWQRTRYGVFDAEGRHVRALNDMRGGRHICFPESTLEQCRYRPERLRKRELLLYGGSLYDHFGHLLVETARAYQLLREFRGSDEPIWFHDATPHRGNTLRLGFVQQWLRCLGIRKRVKLVRRPLQARQLLSSVALYNDRCFVNAAIQQACQAALKPRLRQRLEALPARDRRLAYLSRHKLSGGSNHFAQEAQLVERLAELPRVDVICPEELSYEEKIGLYRRYAIICGFPQSCMNLKLFTPGDALAQQLLLIAGPKSLSSSWINIEHATGFGDLYLDCDQPQTRAEHATPSRESGEQAGVSGFQRSHQFDLERVLAAIRELAG